MKIRHKQQTYDTAVVPSYTLVEESAHYYVVEYCGRIMVLHKSDYEPAPEQRWVDVTKDVKVQHVGGDCKGRGGSEQVTHDIHSIATLHCGGRYRLSKVKVYEITGHGSLPTYEYLKAVDAFVIEKKET